MTRNIQKSRLEPALVEQIRADYLAARTMADTAETADEWESPTDTEARLGALYGLSQSNMHNLVLGLSYAAAPGPIDHVRRAQYERYRADAAKFGPRIAKQRQHASGTVHAAAMKVVITSPTGESQVIIVPAHSTIAVETSLDFHADDEGLESTTKTPKNDTK